MYIPEAFREVRITELHSLIRSNSFGTLVSQHDGALMASHLPFLLDPDRGLNGVLLAHLARANPQWRTFDGTKEILVMFQGPHAYISPTSYKDPLSVPTWNYTAVHAYGIPQIISEPEDVRHLLRTMVSTYETSIEQPWDVDRLPADYLEKMMKGIVAFEVPIARLEGKWKLGQNRSRSDSERVAARLRSAAAAADGMAGLIEKNLAGTQAQ